MKKKKKKNVSSLATGPSLRTAAWPGRSDLLPLPPQGFHCSTCIFSAGWTQQCSSHHQPAALPQHWFGEIVTASITTSSARIIQQLTIIDYTEPHAPKFFFSCHLVF